MGRSIARGTSNHEDFAVRCCRALRALGVCRGTGPEAFDEVSTPRFTRASNGLFAPIHRTTRTVLVSLTTPLFTRGREGSDITTLATRSSSSKVSQSSELREQSTTPAAASSLIASLGVLAVGTVVAMLM